jgi:hypothetical protein
MWALVESNSVSKIYTRPTAITIGFVAATYYTAEDEAANSEHVEGTLKTPRQGTNYPKNIFELWTEAELKAIGIYSITIDNSNLKDEQYYQNTSITYTYNSSPDTVTGAYGTATAKSLTDVLYTATDESNGLGTEGEIKTRGLKPRKKETINNQAYSLLEDSDWLVLRAAEGGTAVPSDWTTYRAAVRTKANSMCTQIDNAADVDALAALYVYNDATPPVRPLGEFPDEPS